MDAVFDSVKTIIKHGELGDDAGDGGVFSGSFVRVIKGLAS